MIVSKTVAGRGLAKQRSDWRFRRRIPLYLMLMPAAVTLLLFHYYPLYGIIIAFKDYSPALGFAKSPWVGLYQFRRIVANPEFVLILRNTLTIAIGEIVAHQVSSIVFALLLNEVRTVWYKRTVQTLSYLLHFVSWMILGGILLDMLSLRGLINGLLASLGARRIAFLLQPGFFQPIAIATDAWKEFGWGAIIYLAALTSIDPSLYEAAAVDGAGRWRRLLNITLPGLLPTIVLLSTLSLGGVLSAGFEQILVLYNPAVISTSDIIDTYVYRAGLLGAQYSLGTAVGLFRSVVSLGLIGLSYYLADRLAGYRIF